MTCLECQVWSTACHPAVVGSWLHIAQIVEFRSFTVRGARYNKCWKGQRVGCCTRCSSPARVTSARERDCAKQVGHPPRNPESPCWCDHRTSMASSAQHRIISTVLLARWAGAPPTFVGLGPYARFDICWMPGARQAPMMRRHDGCARSGALHSSAAYRRRSCSHAASAARRTRPAARHRVNWRGR